jgi:hypothetical protein
MTAYFSGVTLVVVPENDKEREQLKYYGTSGRLWECYGIEETDGSLSVQPMCPVGLQDSEIMGHIRFMLEAED